MLREYVANAHSIAVKLFDANESTEAKPRLKSVVTRNAKDFASTGAKVHDPFE